MLKETEFIISTSDYVNIAPMLIGIVGKPSSGKSTFLNAACLLDVKTGNYPFTTIDPNKGTSYVKSPCVCQELNVQDNPKNSICQKGSRFIPVKLLDVAGLVPEAHAGKGMGFKFLSDLSRADVLIHVVDFSGGLDAEGNEIKEGTRNPLEDIQFLENEIDYWFRDILLRKDWSKFARRIVQEKLLFPEMLFERMNGLIKKHDIILALESGDFDVTRIDKWTDDEMFVFARSLRKFAKPIIIAANKIDKPISKQLLSETSKKTDLKIIPCSALAELWLRKYEQQEIINYVPGDAKFEICDQTKIGDKEITALENIQEKILDQYGSTGIQQIINYAAFNVLDQIIVYPVYDLSLYSDKDGRVLPDAHLIKKGTKLKDFVAQKIHSDLAEHFIYGVDARTKLRLGENYELNDKDIIRIVSAAK